MDTKGDKKPLGLEQTRKHTRVDEDSDETVISKEDEGNHENESEGNKEDEANNETEEKTAEEEEEHADKAGDDKTNEDDDDDDKHNKEEERDEHEEGNDAEEVEPAEDGDDNKAEEESAAKGEDETAEAKDEDETAEAKDEDETAETKDDDETAEAEEHEEEASARGVLLFLDDAGDDQEETEENKEEEEAGEEEDQMVNEMTESQDEDTTEQNGQDLTEEDSKRCRHMFDKKAVNGRLDLRGFKTVFRVLGQIIASDEAERMFEDGDRDGDNTVDFEEFCRLYSKFRQEEQARREAILESVDKLFLCGSGDVVELRKVQQLLLKLQQPDLDTRLVREKSDLGVDEVKHLVKSLDRNGSGYISKQEFVNILCQHLDI